MFEKPAKWNIRENTNNWRKIFVVGFSVWFGSRHDIIIFKYHSYGKVRGWQWVIEVKIHETTWNIIFSFILVIDINHYCLFKRNVSFNSITNVVFLYDVTKVIVKCAMKILVLILYISKLIYVSVGFTKKSGL